MVKFAHLADVHLGGWKQKPMQDLNFKAFELAIARCIKEKVEFVLIAGDLFDTAFPGIEILKETFAQFKKLKDARIPCFIIAGSHDFSVSGKTFLDVLEKAGFCVNVEKYTEKEDVLLLEPHIHEGIAIYGYPGRKAGLEVPQLRKIKFDDAPGMFKIFMLHTTLDKAKGTLPIDAIEADSLPHADYYALGHLHIDFRYENFVYPGPIFPNNFSELEDLRKGSFYLVDTESPEPLHKVELEVKPVHAINLKISDAFTATQSIIEELGKKDIGDKVVLLRLSGIIEKGSHADIKYQKIEEYAEERGAYFLLRNTHNLKTRDAVLDIEIPKEENIEEAAIKTYRKENPSPYNESIPELMNALAIDKQEGETNENFSERILDGAKKVLKFS